MTTYTATSAPHTRLRLTARGRRVVVALIALPVAALLAFAAFHSTPAAVAADETAQAVSFETVVVVPGDTLWSIAGEVAPQADRRDAVAEIARLNMLSGSAIFVGQELAIPVEYSGSDR